MYYGLCLPRPMRAFGAILIAVLARQCTVPPIDIPTIRILACHRSFAGNAARVCIVCPRSPKLLHLKMKLMNIASEWMRFGSSPLAS